MRVPVRVRPRADRTAVGGSHAGALVVRVHEPAVDGRANEAALAALAAAFGLRRREVALVAGASARDKVVELTGDDAAIARRLAELLAT